MNTGRSSCGRGVATQAVAVGAKFVGLFFVKTLECVEQLGFEFAPAAVEQPWAESGADFNTPWGAASLRAGG